MVLGRTMLVLVLCYIVLVPVPTSVDGLLFDFLLDCDLVCGHPAKFEEVHKTNCGCLLGDVKLLGKYILNIVDGHMNEYKHKHADR